MDTQTLWKKIKEEVYAHLEKESAMQGLFELFVLQAHSLQGSLSKILAHHLANQIISQEVLYEKYMYALNTDSNIIEAVCTDINAVVKKDPACDEYSMSLLFFKGFHALQTHRIAHFYWKNDERYFALYLQSEVSKVFAVDIHPAAIIGKGVLIDHATSLVIGETVVVEDNVSLLHEVTLGGTGKAHIDRHPKIRQGSLIGAGAKILGNIEVGENSKIGASSVILEDIPKHSTSVGVPSRVVGMAEERTPSEDMEHRL